MYPRTNTIFTYTTLPGYFLQDDPSTKAEDFDFISKNFGLIDRDYISDEPEKTISKTQWQRFEREVERLNAEAEEGVCYKLLYLGRHGQGVHNVAEQRYGREEWDFLLFVNFLKKKIKNQKCTFINHISPPFSSGTTPPSKATPTGHGPTPISLKPAPNKLSPSTNFGNASSSKPKPQRRRNTTPAPSTAVSRPRISHSLG